MKAKYKNIKTNKEVEVISINRVHTENYDMTVYILHDTTIWERNYFHLNHQFINGDEWLRDALSE